MREKGEKCQKKELSVSESKHEKGVKFGMGFSKVSSIPSPSPSSSSSPPQSSSRPPKASSTVEMTHFNHYLTLDDVDHTNLNEIVIKTRIKDRPKPSSLRLKRRDHIDVPLDYSNLGEICHSARDHVSTNQNKDSIFYTSQQQPRVRVSRYQTVSECTTPRLTPTSKTPTGKSVGSTHSLSHSKKFKSLYVPCLNCVSQLVPPNLITSSPSQLQSQLSQSESHFNFFPTQEQPHLQCTLISSRYYVGDGMQRNLSRSADECMGSERGDVMKMVSCVCPLPSQPNGNGEKRSTAKGKCRFCLDIF